MPQVQSNGITLEYDRAGPADGPPLLLIHGVGAQMVRWPQGLCDGLAAAGFDAILIDRTAIKVHQSPVDLMLREAGTSHSLIVFPEGGRSVSGEIDEFKSGLYYLAKKRPDIELIPVHIDNLNRVLPRGEFLPVPLLSCISFGPPLWLERGEAKLDFLARARRAVMSLKE